MELGFLIGNAHASCFTVNFFPFPLPLVSVDMKMSLPWVAEDSVPRLSLFP